ncbi:MAG: class II fructose-bisphosphate aldolase [Acidobacteria bacterium]|nr:class II fructose-bisphosphate aldolase [Acidobacteriota bacterium]
MFLHINEFFNAVSGVLDFTAKGVRRVVAPRVLRGDLIDRLTYNAVFNPDEDIKCHCRLAIRSAADRLGIYPASIHEFYMQKGKGHFNHFTVPAINIRGLTYDVARTVFDIINEHKIGPLIFEIARSEINYSQQWPSEYSVVVTAAAIKTGYTGPVFLQGDHFQVKAALYEDDPDMEIEAIKLLIRDSLGSGFYNIDIDTSTLVDLTKETIDEQQRRNYELCAMFTDYIRRLEPNNISVSVGGEIGEVGGKNSTLEELTAFMEGFLLSLKKYDPYAVGLSKISIQTGTTHGGIPMPDGSIAEVKLDFATLESLSRLARQRFGMAGAVQHGASTLPDEMFHHFPQSGTAEIHLATAFQNIILDHPQFPAELKAEMYDHICDKHGAERKEGQTFEQFLYKTRKKIFGPFKKRLWDLPDHVRTAIQDDLRQKFVFIFQKLNVVNTRDSLRDTITPPLTSFSLDREKATLR